MANKYCNWNMARCYVQKDMVEEDIFEEEKEWLLQPYNSQIIDMEESPLITEYCHRFLNFEMLEIVARIACSRGVTLRQLVCFLRLQGYDVDTDIIEEFLGKLLERDIIRKIAIDIDICNIMQKGRCLEFHWLGSQGWDIAKALGVPVPTKKQTSFMLCNYGKKRYILSTILWNQIVINQLLYNPHVLHFKIHDTVRIKNKENIHHIPLLLRTKKQDYIFEYTRGKYMKRNYLEEVLKQWKEYEENSKKKSYLVLACEDKKAAKRVNRVIGEMEVADNNIFYTEDKLWWNGESGSIFKWAQLDNREVSISIDTL